jgi:PAP2 superfamily
VSQVIEMTRGHLRRTGLLAALAVLLAVAAAPARADTVTDWNQTAANVLIGTAPPLQPPQITVPHLAMVHGALYDAVNAIDGSHEGYLLSARVARPTDSQDAAAAVAAHRVLVRLVPAQQPVLDAQLASSLTEIPDGRSKQRGIAVGEAAAAAMIAARTDDGRFGTPGFPVGTAPGVWGPVLPAFVNDPNAWLRDVDPFLIRSSSQFRSAGPYPLTSRRYARDFEEVRSLGSATNSGRTAGQTLAAQYWAENPAVTWNRTFRTLSAQQGLSLVDNARFFAVLYMTATDALISVWDDKAHWSFWRPITAIREADTDGNPRTEPDSGWLPLIPTPPYPEHPSGHTGFSGSIVKTLQQFFGTDRIGWSDTNAAGTREFTRFSQAIDDVVDARVWSGLHFRNADEQGERIGSQVARYVGQRYFERLHH